MQKKGILPNNVDRKFELVIGKAFNERCVISESKVLRILKIVVRCFSLDTNFTS